MVRTSHNVSERNRSSVPAWVFLYSDEQFVQWCSKHNLQVCDEVRSFPGDERAAIFRYALRQHLVN